MAEPRGNHLAIDGGQVKEDEHIGSYKPLPEVDTEDMEFDDTEDQSVGKDIKVTEGWTYTRVITLLEEYLVHVEQFRNPASNEVDLWEKVSAAVGLPAQNCMKKFRYMKLFYVKLLRKAKAKGVPMTVNNWAFFDLFEDIFKVDGEYLPDIQEKIQDVEENEVLPSKSSLTKSREKVSSDGAEEKLLQKEDEAKITTRVDMADAKYVVEDHRNGDAKIELDANKRQFSGLSKEELMKYADDPFWVRLRWFMFILFWTLWLCMLAGAVTIIVRAPKCAPPPPKTWFQKGPLVDAAPTSPGNLPVSLLKRMEAIKAPGVILSQPDVYNVLDDESIVKKIADQVALAKKYSVKIILDVVADYVPVDHKWFQLSLNRTAEYAAYFIWANGTEFDDAGKLKRPNNWVSKTNTEAWTWSDARKEFYYHRGDSGTPQLNMTNPLVVRQFDDVLKKIMKTGVAGVRFQARDMLVDPALTSEVMAQGQGADLSADHSQYTFWRHQHTSDQPGLDSLLLHWSHVVDSNAVEEPNTGNTVFTISEESGRSELYLLQRESGYLRPPTAAAIDLQRAAPDVARELNVRLASGRWPIVELAQNDSTSMEAGAFLMVLAGAPALRRTQLHDAQRDVAANDTALALEQFSRLATLRSDASVEHGNSTITAVPAHNTSDELLVCARWKAGHTGYAAVWNPLDVDLYANLSSVHPVPQAVTLHYASPLVKETAHYTIGQALKSDQLLVPGLSTVLLSYVPKTTVEK